MAPTDFKVPPVVKTILYAGSAKEAFDRFTLAIGTWWPLAPHSIGREDAGSAGLERLEVGGALLERSRSGEHHVWGSIVYISRPRAISFSWHVGRTQDAAQLIEPSFEPAGDGATQVTLRHPGWERLGDKALEARQSYDSGWEPVLARYAGGHDA